MSATGSPREGLLTLDRPDDVARVRDTLDRVGFDDRNILDRMGAGSSIDLNFGVMERPRILRRTRGGDPIATLIRLFLAGIPVPFDDFQRAIAPMDPALWAELGLVEVEGDSVRRCVVLRPSEGFIVAHDFPLPDGGMRRDHVLGVTRSTLTLAGTLMRIPSRRTLDLGSGGGYLAMLAAQHSDQVVATDINPRAVDMARFNMQLNRIGNVEAVQGDLFEPAGDRRFDLIISNPPFVISPEAGLIFRDSGRVGDEICERIIRQAPAYLEEGGYAQILCNWIRPAGQDWMERLAGWFEDSGCDAWVIQGTSLDPMDYAYHWMGQADASVKEAFAERFDRWMDYYERQGIAAIDFGMINLRRRTSGPNWVHFDVDRGENNPNGTGIFVGFFARDLLQRIADLDGPGILAGFAARDMLQATADLPSFLTMRLRCRPEVRFSQILEPASTGWIVGGAQCVLGEGLRFEGDVNPLVFHLLTLCRGETTLSEVIAQVAARLGQDVEAVLPACAGTARALFEQGFLWPADIPLEPPGLVQFGTGDLNDHARG